MKRGRADVGHDCPVCAYPFSNKKRSRIECPACAYESCAHCVETYLLQERGLQAPRCMSCASPWHVDFLKSQLSVAAFRRVQAHLEDCCFERERSKLPDTIHLLQFRRRAAELRAEASEVADRAGETRRQLEFLLTRRQDLLLEADRQTELGSFRPEGSNARRFICACPVNDCAGFVERASMHCGVCQSSVCPDCWKPDGAEHRCEPQDVETVNALQYNTMPCPSCNVRIYRISGCDQMWCTHCRTTFSWESGRVIRVQTIHNPHFIEAQRAARQGIVVRQGCADEQVLWMDMADLNIAVGVPQPMTTTRFSMLEGSFVLAFGEAILRLRRRHPETATGQTEDIEHELERHLTDLRVEFLQNNIAEDAWRSGVKSARRKYGQKLENRRIISMCVQAAYDMLEVFLFETDLTTLRDTIDAAAGLLRYTNECMQRCKGSGGVWGFRADETKTFPDGRRASINRDFFLDIIEKERAGRLTPSKVTHESVVRRSRTGAIDHHNRYRVHPGDIGAFRIEWTKL